MTAQPKMSDLTSDIIGLTKAPHVSRRGFMTAAAAAAAGYTGGAGGLGAGARRRDPAGLKPGEGRGRVVGGEMRFSSARPETPPTPPVILVAMEIFGLHEWVKDITRRVAKLGA